LMFSWDDLPSGKHKKLWKNPPCLI
jgi:hypothetical protein